MPTTVFDDIVHTDYGQFDLIWELGDDYGFDGDFHRFFRGQVNGLVGAADPGGIYVNLARRSGGSQVTIVVQDTEPPVLDTTREDIVAVSTTVPVDATPRWVSWAGESGGELEIAPGGYRVRVSAQGRDAGHLAEFADGVVDRYRLDFWPAAWEPDEIVRTSSENAAYWHRAIGNRRAPGS